jgi:hypothetical protein
VTNALERLFGDGTEAAHKSSGLARNREGASLLAETAALAGPVAMRRKTANHGSLRTKKPKGEIFLPAKP